MSKLSLKTMKQTETKIGVLIHMDTLRTCAARLDTSKRGELLETLLNAYYPKEFPRSNDFVVQFAFDFLHDNIQRNDSKYAQKKAKQEEYWDNWRKRKAAQEAQSDAKSAKNCNTLQSGASTTSTSVTEVKSSTSTTPSATTTSTTSTTPSTTSSVIDNSITEENINKKSLSNHIKYTLPEVEKILAEREIFFKQDSLRKFYHLNNENFHWKYDPISAAEAYIRIHPGCLKGNNKENAPQYAAPPTPQVVKISEEYAKLLKEDGDRIWAALREELANAIPSDKVRYLDNVLFAEAYRNGYSAWRMQLVFSTSLDVSDFKSLISSTEEWRALVEKYKISSVRCTSNSDWKKVREAA